MRVVHTSKSPFEVILLVLVIVTGTVGLLEPGHGGAVIYALPTWSRYTWYAGLVISGLISLAGVTTSRLWSLFLERGGLGMLGVLLLAYAVGIMVAAGPVVAVSAVLTVGFSAACFVRVHQISGDIRHVLEGEDTR